MKPRANIIMAYPNLSKFIITKRHASLSISCVVQLTNTFITSVYVDAVSIVITGMCFIGTLIYIQRKTMVMFIKG